MSFCLSQALPLHGDYFFKDAFRHSRLRTKQMLNLSHLEGELLPPPPPWLTPHSAVSAWLNMSIYTHLAPLMRANLPWIDF